MSALVEYFRAGGPLMIPLAILCVAMWYWLLALGPRLRRERTSARIVQDLLHERGPSKPLDAIARWARLRRGPVARVALHAIGGEITAESIRQRCEEARLAEVPRFALELRILRALVGAAPLLGLLGTVRGMVSTFTVLSVEGTSSVELLSAGISEALVTTQVGLLVALPGVAGAYALSRRVSDLEVALETMESHLVETASSSSATRLEGAS